MRPVSKGQVLSLWGGSRAHREALVVFHFFFSFFFLFPLFFLFLFLCFPEPPPAAHPEH